RALDSLHGHAHDRAGPRASRGHDADDADDGRRGARARLRAHGASQGPHGARPHLSPRAEERDAPDPRGHRATGRRGVLWLRDRRVRVQLARDRTPASTGDRLSGLPGHPRHRTAPVDPLRSRQPRHRSLLRLHEPAAPQALAIFVLTFLGPRLENLILTMGILFIPRYARVAHVVTLAAKEKDYVEAARSIGARAWRIIGLAILPNVFAPLIVQISLGVGSAILIESGLSFLGLGPPPPAASWGRSIQQSARFMQLNPHVVIWPSL